MNAHEVANHLLDAAAHSDPSRLVEASVRLPPRSSRWVAVFTGITPGKQVWKSTGLTDRAEALAKAKEWEAEARRQRAASGKQRKTVDPKHGLTHESATEELQVRSRFTDAKGKTRQEGLKHQVPASSTYALSLFGHCVMDGLQCWEIGTRYSEDLQDYSDWTKSEPMVKRTINGVETALNYYTKYFGLYNFHVLGMWQASQNKDIIEAATKWEMPEIRSSKGNVWRVGDERYPSYVNLYKEPLVRAKLSADGKTLLVLACNPHNQGVEQVRVRRPGGAEEYGFELVGDYPVVKRFVVAQPSRAL